MGNREFNRVDFKAVSRAALDAADRLLPVWLPDGKRVNGEWVARNPTRNDSAAGSFSVSRTKGVWKDFATGDGGADLISLYAFLQGLSPLDACRELHALLGVPMLPADQAPAAGASSVQRVDDDFPWVCVLPVPDDAPAPHVAHVKRGKPEVVRCYKDAAGNVLGYIYRFRTSDGGKDDIPHTLWRHKQTGALEWKWRQWPEPRPLYGLDALAAQPEAWVLVVEGEKCRDVAAAALPELAVVAWPGGCNGVAKVDFSPLAGRKLIMWPDADAQRVKLAKDEIAAGVDPLSKPILPLADQPGSKAMMKVAMAVLAVDADTTIRVVGLPEPGAFVGGWDVADAIELDGWPAEQVRAFIRDNLQPLRAGVSTHSAACAGRDVAAGSAQAVVEGEEADAWKQALLWSETGLRPVFANAFEILRHDPAWVGVLAYDEFSGQVMKLRAPPWAGAQAGRWSDGDNSKALVWLQQQYRLFLKTSAVVDEAAKAVAFDQRFHPVRDYLNGLVWDGVERLGSWLADVYGADQDEYTAHVGKGWLVSAVARVMKPGCKVDEMVVLEGGQGAGKSTSLAELVGPQWYLETSDNPSGKDFYIALQGKWVVEIGEMNSFTRAEITQVKQAITRRDDTFRAPYERNATSHPRQCILTGTTNAEAYLNDPTGARRFLPLRCNGPVNLDYIRNNRDQMWAEAVTLFKSGFRYWDYPKDLAAALQDDRYIEDAWIEPITDYLEGRKPNNAYPSDHAGQVNEVTTSDLMVRALAMPYDRQTRQEQMRVAAILKRMGWQKTPQRGDGKRYYVRPESSRRPAQANGGVGVPADF